MHLFLATLISLSSSAYADRFAGDNSSGHVKFDLGSTLHNVPGNATSFTSEITIDEGISGVLTIQAAAWIVSTPEMPSSMVISEVKLVAFPGTL